MKYRFESIYVKDGQITLQGFLIGDQPSSKGTYLVKKNGQEIPFELKETVRNDVGDRFFHEVVENHYGFMIQFPYDENGKYDLLLLIENKEIVIHLTPFFIWKTVTWNSFKNNAKVQDIVFRIRNRKTGNIPYSKWYKMHQTTEEELDQQRKRQWSDNAPMFSIVIPMYKTPEKYLRALIDTFENQTYTKFEVCFGDGSPDESLKEMIDSYHDERLKYQHLTKNGGISDNTNEAMKMATGDFIVLCDHDDLLTEDALYCFADQIVNDSECDAIYSDEDKIDNHGNVYQPHFKPDYNIDLLSCNNYISHLFAVRKSLVDEYGMLKREYDGAQDHDFILRMCEQSRHVCHVPKVLYHWRSHPDSTASGGEAKLYAFENGKKVVQDHFERVYPEFMVDHVEIGESYGIYHPFFKIEEEPCISIIIPNKDHIDELEQAIVSIEENSTWKNKEFIIIENNSTEESTFQFYNDIQKKYSNVKVVYYEGDFNYSKINNFGVKHATGEYYLFLNNDTKMITPSALEEMYWYARRKNTGAVGCQLLYPDHTIQHAGVVVGIGVADHVFKGQLPENGQTYFNRAMTIQDYSAVTAASMMVRKDVFEKVNGFDEQLAVAFNDIDFCLRLRKENYLVVYNPYASFYHYESKSRGKDITGEQRNRYMSELEFFNTRWKDFLKECDPYYNPNLTLEKTDYSLRK